MTEISTNGERELPTDRVRRLNELQQQRDAAAREYDQELLACMTRDRYSVTAVARSLGVTPTTIRHKRDRILLQELGSKTAA
jgi:transposase-like protein